MWDVKPYYTMAYHITTKNCPKLILYSDCILSPRLPGDRVLRQLSPRLLEPGDGMRGVWHECVTKLWRPSFDSNCHPGSSKPRRLRN